MTKIQKIWFIMNQKKKRIAGITGTEKQGEAAEFYGEVLRFLHDAEFALTADGSSYAVVYNGSAAEFRDNTLFLQ